MKKCSICGYIKGINNFPFQNKSLDKYTSACKECRNISQNKRRNTNIEEKRRKDREYYQKNKEVKAERMRIYRKNNKHKTRETHLKCTYGITTEIFNNMLNIQNNKCLICGRDFKDYSKTPCVDHNHITGKIRGILCNPCNYGLGFYEKYNIKYKEYLKNYD